MKQCIFSKKQNPDNWQLFFCFNFLNDHFKTLVLREWLYLCALVRKYLLLCDGFAGAILFSLCLCGSLWVRKPLSLSPTPVYILFVISVDVSVCPLQTLVRMWESPFSAHLSSFYLLSFGHTLCFLAQEWLLGTRNKGSQFVITVKNWRSWDQRGTLIYLGLS